MSSYKIRFSLPLMTLQYKIEMSNHPHRSQVKEAPGELLQDPVQSAIDNTEVGGLASKEMESDDHVVQSGETLSKLAESHDTTVSELAAKNDISNPDHIEAGQKLSF